MQWAQLALAADRLRAACDLKMSLQGKHSRTNSESPPEKQAKQHRPYESPSESPHYVPNEPENVKASEREIAAANAARERLYGGRGGIQADVATGRLPTGVEPSPVTDVDYIPRADLQPYQHPEEELEMARNSCQSSEWTTVCAGLLGFRRLAVHHKEVVWESLPGIVTLVLKSVKNLRSSVSKTAIMAAADLIETFGNDFLPLMDTGGPSKPAGSLLAQLLLKGSSNDKRFVIDEVQRALDCAAKRLSPLLFLEQLLPYTSHKSAKIRGISISVLAASAEHLKPNEWSELGLDQLLRLAGKLVSDNTPEARAAAKKLAGIIHEAHKRQVEEKENAQGWSPPLNSPRGKEESGKREEGGAGRILASWEDQCKTCLGAAQATAILKVTERK